MSGPLLLVVVVVLLVIALLWWLAGGDDLNARDRVVGFGISVVFAVCGTSVCVIVAALATLLARLAWGSV